MGRAMVEIFEQNRDLRPALQRYIVFQILSFNHVFRLLFELAVSSDPPGRRNPIVRASGKLSAIGKVYRVKADVAVAAVVHSDHRITVHCPQCPV